MKRNTILSASPLPVDLAFVADICLRTEQSRFAVVDDLRHVLAHHQATQICFSHFVTTPFGNKNIRVAALFLEGRFNINNIMSEIERWIVSEESTVVVALGETTAAYGSYFDGTHIFQAMSALRSAQKTKLQNRPLVIRTGMLDVDILLYHALACAFNLASDKQAGVQRNDILVAVNNVLNESWHVLSNAIAKAAEQAACKWPQEVEIEQLQGFCYAIEELLRALVVAKKQHINMPKIIVSDWVSVNQKHKLICQQCQEMVEENSLQEMLQNMIEKNEQKDKKYEAAAGVLSAVSVGVIAAVIPLLSSFQTLNSFVSLLIVAANGAIGIVFFLLLMMHVVKPREPSETVVGERARRCIINPRTKKQKYGILDVRSQKGYKSGEKLVEDVNKTLATCRRSDFRKLDYLMGVEIIKSAAWNWRKRWLVGIGIFFMVIALALVLLAMTIHHLRGSQSIVNRTPEAQVRVMLQNKPE